MSPLSEFALPAYNLAVGYRLVIFDFDGTLADSGDWVRQVFNQVAVRFRFRQVSAEEIEMLRGHGNRELVRYLGVPTWKLPLIARHIRRLVAADCENIQLFSGAPDLLRTLSESGARLAIVSSNAEENIRRILGPDNAARIDFFECGASVFGKARKFRRVCRRAGVRPADALCIGDETRDIEAAKAAGIASGAVEWGYHTPENLARFGPTVMFASMADIHGAVVSQT